MESEGNGLIQCIGWTTKDRLYDEAFEDEMVSSSIQYKYEQNLNLSIVGLDTGLDAQEMMFNMRLLAPYCYFLFLAL